MSVETPPTPDSQHRSREDQRGEDISQVVSRVEAWLTTSSDVDVPDHPEALDEQPRRWGVLDPSATRIGRSEPIAGHVSEAVAEHAAHVASPVDDAPEDDRDERLRVLHAECDATMQGNSERRERLDAERRAWLGLDDREPNDEQLPGLLAELSDRLHRLTGSDAYDRLRAECDLTAAAVDRLEARIENELDEETLREAALGRSPYRDPYLPPFAHYGPDASDYQFRQT